MLFGFNRFQSVSIEGLSCARDNHCNGDEQMDSQYFADLANSKMEMFEGCVEMTLPHIQPDLDVNQCIVYAEVTGEKLSSLAMEAAIDKQKEKLRV